MFLTQLQQVHPHLTYGKSEAAGSQPAQAGLRAGQCSWLLVGKGSAQLTPLQEPEQTCRTQDPAQLWGEGLSEEIARGAAGGEGLISWSLWPPSTWLQRWTLRPGLCPRWGQSSQARLTGTGLCRLLTGKSH